MSIELLYVGGREHGREVGKGGFFPCFINFTGAVLLHDTIISIMPTLPLRLTCSGSENSLLECEHIDYFLPEGAFPPPCAVHDPAAIRCEGKIKSYSILVL